MTAQLASQKLSITIEAGPVIKGEGRFSSAAFSPDGASIITISNAGCDLWDAQTGQHMKKLTLGDAGYRTRADVSKRHYDALYPQTDDEKTAAAGAMGFADYAVTARNGRLIALGSNSGDLRVVDLGGGTPLFLNGHSTSMNNHMRQNSITAMVFDESSSFLISMADEDSSPLLWDLTAQGKDVTRGDKPARLLDEPVQLNDVTPGGIDTVAFSPTEPKFICTHRMTETVAVWQIVRKA
jgi:WD40 repeat protein